MKTKLNNLQEIAADKGNKRDGSVYLEGVTPITPIHVLENWPFWSGQGCFSDSLASQICVCFSLFALTGRVLQKVNLDQCLMLIITPAWLGQPCFSGLLKMSGKNPLSLPAPKDLLKNPAGKLNLLVMRNLLRLVAWIILGRTYLQKKYEKGLLTSSQTIVEHFQSSMTESRCVLIIRSTRTSFIVLQP